MSDMKGWELEEGRIYDVLTGDKGKVKILSIDRSDSYTQVTEYVWIAGRLKGEHATHRGSRDQNWSLKPEEHIIEEDLSWAS